MLVYKNFFFLNRLYGAARNRPFNIKKIPRKSSLIREQTNFRRMAPVLNRLGFYLSVGALFDLCPVVLPGVCIIGATGPPATFTAEPELAFFCFNIVQSNV